MPPATARSASPARPSTVRLVALAVAVALLAIALGACGTGDKAADDGKPTIVVTYSILGAVVRDLVGDAAHVEVVMPNGTDPHDYKASAKAVAKIHGADVIVTNGLELEAALDGAIADAKKDGAPVFVATDHITVRQLTGGEAAREDAEAAAAGRRRDPSTGNGDPHFWTDPQAMSQVAEALSEFLQVKLHLDVSASAAATVASLEALDTHVAATLAAVPASRRKLVTGHESLGYFADRYDFALIGAVIPSASSQAEPSARQIADLEKVIEAAEVPAIFNEIGTPKRVVEAIQRETKVKVVELPTHALPKSGSYADFMDNLATKIAGALQ